MDGRDEQINILNSEIIGMRNKINEYEQRQNKFLNELSSNENVINGLKNSNKNNGILIKYQTLESKWVSIYNEGDEITNIKNELEEECEKTQLEVWNYIYNHLML